jgi:hypothetical protein
MPVSQPNDICNFCCSGECAADRSCCASTGWSCDQTHECCGTDFCDASGSCEACYITVPGSSNAACSANNQCCSGHCQQTLCCQGVNGGATTPDPGSAAPLACGSRYCCGGLSCCNDGDPPRCTLPNGATCTSNLDCCSIGGSGGCHNGLCCEPAGLTAYCAGNSDCCAPATCSATNGNGKKYCCLPKGSTCTDIGCYGCCTPPSTIPPTGSTGTCQ